MLKMLSKIKYIYLILRNDMLLTRSSTEFETTVSVTLQLDTVPLHLTLGLLLFSNDLRLFVGKFIDNKIRSTNLLILSV